MIEPEVESFRTILFIGFNFWGIISLVIILILLYYLFNKFKNKK